MERPDTCRQHLVVLSKDYFRAQALAAARFPVPADDLDRLKGRFRSGERDLPLAILRTGAM